MPSTEVVITLDISSCRSLFLDTKDGRMDKLSRRYLKTSSLLARISSVGIPLSLSVISGMNREVAKTFTLEAAWSLNIVSSNLEHVLLDISHSSRASISTKTLRCPLFWRESPAPRKSLPWKVWYFWSYFRLTFSTRHWAQSAEIEPIVSERSPVDGLDLAHDGADSCSIEM